jgi:hypothetical protein
MADQQGKKDAKNPRPVAVDLGSEISYFAWKRRPDLLQPAYLERSS